MRNESTRPPTCRSRPSISPARPTSRLTRLLECLSVPSANALYKRVKRQGIPTCRWGQKRLFFRLDLDAAVQPARPVILSRHRVGVDQSGD